MYLYNSKQDWIPESVQYILSLWLHVSREIYSLLRQEIMNTLPPLQSYININIFIAAQLSIICLTDAIRSLLWICRLFPFSFFCNIYPYIFLSLRSLLFSLPGKTPVTVPSSNAPSTTCLLSFFLVLSKLQFSFPLLTVHFVFILQ